MSCLLTTAFNRRRLLRLSLLSLLVVAVTIALVTKPACAGSYIPLESEVYRYLKILEAEGLITTGQLATLPISRLEGARLTTEARENVCEETSPRLQGMLIRLQDEFKMELANDESIYLKPLDSLNLRYVNSDGKSFFAQKNRDGVEVRNGNNAFLDLTTRFDSPYVGVVVKPEVDVSDDGTKATLKKAYLLATIGRAELMFGKESAWWGPGQNGSILLSTNAEPLTTLKLSNSVPYFPLGVGFRGTIFIAELEKDRKDVQSPLLNGIRLDLKPSRYLELGLSKTVIFGGKGRKSGFDTFLKTLYGGGSNQNAGFQANDTGDQRAGYDVKVVLPWRWQPVTLYLDAAGEDQRHSFPSKWFFLYGVYLPRVLNLDRLELWGEYGTNNDHDFPGVWYTNYAYAQGYTHKGRIIGHHMGPDATDLFLRARYNFDSAAVTVSYENLTKLNPSRYIREYYSASLEKELFHNAQLAIAANYAREDSKKTVVEIGLHYQF